MTGTIRPSSSVLRTRHFVPVSSRPSSPSSTSYCVPAFSGWYSKRARSKYWVVRVCPSIGLTSSKGSLIGKPKSVVDTRVPEILELVGLGEKLNSYPDELSGGEQQRVSIARACVNRPLILLADEPTGNLDTRTSVEILVLLQQLNRQGITIVLVTHELDIAAFASRVLTLRDGRLQRDEPVLSPRDASVAQAQLEEEAVA